MRLLFVLFAFATAAACTSQPTSSSFKVATDAEAESIVRAFLDAEARGLTAEVCDTKAVSSPRAAHLTLVSYQILAVEPAWSGAEPYYRVDVDLAKDDGRKESLSLSVRAREGCVDRLLGVPVEPARPGSGEIAL
jgi:hypothetical protein